jgi:hypothetical protein
MESGNTDWLRRLTWHIRTGRLAYCTKIIMSKKEKWGKGKEDGKKLLVQGT